MNGRLEQEKGYGKRTKTEKIAKLNVKRGLPDNTYLLAIPDNN